MIWRGLFLLACAASLTACADDSETGRRVDRTADLAVERMQAPLDAARDVARIQEERLRETEPAWDE